MATSSTWEIYQGSTKLAGDSFKLTKGETTQAAVTGYYGTLTLKIVSGPGQGLTADTDCATPTPTPTSTPVPPKLELTGSCTANGAAAFVITNSGGDMATSSTWEIYQGSTKLAGDTFKLTKGETTQAAITGYYGTLTLKIVSGPGQGLSADTDCATPTPTPTPTSDASLSIDIGGGGSSCGPIYFDLNVANTGQRSTATEVVVDIQVIKGSQYVASMTPTRWVVGDILPGQSRSTQVVVQVNDAWKTVPANTEIQIKATIVKETSLSIQTVGKSFVGTASCPGNCFQAATPTPTPKVPGTPKPPPPPPTPTPVSTATPVPPRVSTPVPPAVTTPLPACPGCGAGCPACPPVPVFHTDEDGNWDIARLPLKGENVEGIVNLTRSPGRDLGPTISADGQWIAFQTERDGNWEIYTMDFMGRHQTRQTTNPARDTDPVWSPRCGIIGQSCITGTLAFQSDRTGNWDIFLLNTGTDAEPFQVTTNRGNDIDPAWSPDGSMLTFQSDRAGNWDIFTIKADGTDEVTRTTNTADEVNPTWSPSGGSIAYNSDRSGDWDVYLLDLKTNQERQVISGKGDDLLQAWSPDGAWLAFQSNRDGNWEIYAYNVAQGTLVRLTDNPAADEAPTWNCDGTHVVFQSNRDGNTELYSVALADPKDVTRLTNQLSTEQYAAWQPLEEDGSRAMEAAPVVASNLQPTPTPPATATPAPLPTPTGTPPPTATPARLSLPVIVPTPLPVPPAPPGCQPCSQQPSAILGCPSCPPVPVFQTDKDHNWDIARLPLEGEQGIVNLTQSPGRDLSPALSPDSWWIAFQSERDGNWEIYTVDFMGRHQTRQTYNPASDTDPVWSPICQKDKMNGLTTIKPIVPPCDKVWTPACANLVSTCLTGTLAFQSDRTGNWDIFLLNAGSGLEPFRVTTSPGDDTDPAWSPDGSALTYQSNRDGNWDIFTIRTDGIGEVQWTDNPADEVNPNWSPDGGSIAYDSNRSGDWDLYLFDLKNKQERQITSGKGDDLLPAWSPDGDWLAFQSNRDGNWEIYAYNVISNSLVRLTDSLAADEAPTWNCDGTRVIFQSNRYGDPELYSVALSNPENIVRLTEQASAEQYAAWQPHEEDGSLALAAPAGEAVAGVAAQATPKPTDTPAPAQAAQPTPTQAATTQAMQPTFTPTAQAAAQGQLAGTAAGEGGASSVPILAAAGLVVVLAVIGASWFMRKRGKS
jgi:Tol biopolymer transport system component